jgi:hypothetical protein
MNPELGLVVAASPKRKLTYLSGCGNEIFELVRLRGLEQSAHGVSDVQDALYCYNGCFLAEANSLEGADKLAFIALEH